DDDDSFPVQLFSDLVGERAFFQFAGAAECSESSVRSLSHNIRETDPAGYACTRPECRAAQDAHRTAVSVGEAVAHGTCRVHHVNAIKISVILSIHLDI